MDNKICHMPFEFVNIDSKGNVWPCCPGWIKSPIGNILDQNIKDNNDFKSIWKSELAVKIRDSILKGTYKYCNTNFCGFRNGHKSTSDSLKKMIRSGPKHMVLSIDRSCNLYCRSCRDKIYKSKKKEKDNIVRIGEYIINNMSSDIEILEISGAGDPFANNVELEIAKRLGNKKKGIKLNLLTNGQLINIDEITEIRRNGISIGNISISMDTVSKQKYPKIRRGGDFDRLIKNIKWLVKERNNGRIDKIELHFVIQLENYREIPKMVEFKKEYDVDLIVLSKIQNWGTYSQKEFDKHNIFKKEHSEYGKIDSILSDLRKCSDALLINI